MIKCLSTVVDSPDVGLAHITALAASARRPSAVFIFPKPSCAPTRARTVDHLARHGYASERHVCQASGRPVAEVLQTFATLRHVQLLAIGAYAHSRVRELIFGGTTRQLIAFQRLPILMMH